STSAPVLASARLVSAALVEAALETIQPRDPTPLTLQGRPPSLPQETVSDTLSTASVAASRHWVPPALLIGAAAAALLSLGLRQVRLRSHDAAGPVPGAAQAARPAPSPTPAPSALAMVQPIPEGEPPPDGEAGLLAGPGKRADQALTTLPPAAQAKLA